MKKLILLSLFLPFGFVSNAQERDEEEISVEEIKDAFADSFEKLSKGVNLTVDKKLFPLQMGNVFISNTPRASLMSRVKVGTYAKAKDAMAKDAKKGGITIVEQGEITINGRTMLYQYGERTDDAGIKLRVDVYAYQADASNMAYILGTYVITVKEVYSKATKNAASTAVYKPAE